MAHYALLDENNVVTNVITGRHEDEVVDGISDWEAYYGDLHNQTCKRTSYTSYAGKRINPETGDPVDEPAFRKNYGSVGFFYDAERDAFISPKPFASWILNESTCLWDAPVARPAFDPEDKNFYTWNEETLSWDATPILVNEN
jgi:hypothetical protein